MEAAEKTVPPLCTGAGRFCRLQDQIRPDAAGNPRRATRRSILNPVTCLQKLKYIGTLFCATVDKTGAPEVRCVSGIHVEDNAIYFLTARGKEFAHQLHADPRVQIAGLTRYGEMIRVTGEVNQLEGASADRMRDRIFAAHPELQDIYPGQTQEINIVFGLHNMVIDYFNIESSPIFRESYTIGDADVIPSGYLITENCIECGKCLDVCPQGIIEESSPYEIDQRHCLRCGACQEVCPADAVASLPLEVSEGN